MFINTSFVISKLPRETNVNEISFHIVKKHM
jgi:hypothetical protein